MSVAIKVENLSKAYQIGQIGTGTISRDIERWWTTRVMGKEDPFLTVGETNDRTKKSESNVVWSLKDINLEIEQGDAVGIIGKNGAGKSTLLKLLSRVTAPTKGSIKIRGRIASLLEVGTGFHPDLTGRENIFLNGSILGMRKKEIQRKLDEIVDFSGIERYIDTPVKRYSSGMYVRLAFAVAAHLENEILIVDEVLAVGDAEFQKKCLGKLGDVAQGGRTVLFVSHNMAAISQLTRRCILLQDGGCHFDGPTEIATAHYINSDKRESRKATRYERAHEPENNNYIQLAEVITSGGNGVHDWGQPITFRFELKVSEPASTMCFSFQVVNEFDQSVCHFWLFDPDLPFRQKSGVYKLECEAPKFRLYMGKYSIKTFLSDRRSRSVMENLSDICHFEVTLDKTHRPEYAWQPKDCTYIDEAVWAVEGQDDDNVLAFAGLDNPINQKSLFNG